MIRRIVLENFMSHRRTVLEPAPGLTVLAGPNNCGKSAVVGALQVLCRNLRGDWMVRHGEKTCRVVVETDDGHEVEWKRHGSTVSYTIDGEDIHRLQGRVPDRLHEALRLPLVGDPEDAFEIHLAEQKTPIFLLDRPGSRAATFFASSSDAAHLLEMQRRHRRNESKRRFEETQLARRESKLDRLAESLEALGEIDDRVAAAEALHRDLTGREARADRLAGEIEAIRRRRRVASCAEAEFAALEPLESPPHQHDLAAIASLRRGLSRVTDRVREAEARGSTLADLPPPPEPRSLGPLEELIGRMRRAGRQLARTVELDAGLAGLPEPPDLADPTPLASARDALVRARRTVEEREKALTGIAAERQDLTREVRRWAEAHPQCPTCGGDVVAERLLEATDGGDHGCP